MSVVEYTQCLLVMMLAISNRDWALANKMVINMSKTKELVFYRPHPSRSHMPLAVDNIEQVKIARLLGVIFSCNLNFDEHVTFLLSICLQRLYLIKLLRSKECPRVNCMLYLLL